MVSPEALRGMKWQGNSSVLLAFGNELHEAALAAGVPAQRVAVVDAGEGSQERRVGSQQCLVPFEAALLEVIQLEAE